MNDIRFEYILGKDTAEGIAAELVGAGLVDPHDSVPISDNLSKLLQAQVTSSQSLPKAVTFHLVRLLFITPYNMLAYKGMCFPSFKIPGPINEYW